MRTTQNLSLHFAAANPAAMASSILEALYRDAASPAAANLYQVRQLLEYSNSWKIDKRLTPLQRKYPLFSVKPLAARKT